MTQATINGNTYSDDGSAAKDMNNGGHRTHFLPLVNDVVTVAGQVAADKATVATDKAVVTADKSASQSAASAASASSTSAQNSANAAATSATNAAASAVQSAASAVAAAAIVTGVASNRPSIRPSLLLDFANTKQLDPRITFSRASTGTYYDGKTVVKAEENLLTYSDQFDNAIWTKVTTTVTANSTTAPDGTNTADTFTATADGAKLGQTLVYGDGGTSILSVWIKRKTGTGNVELSHTINGTTTVVVVDNTWQRFSVSSALTNGNRTLGIKLATNGDEVYIWGAQLEQRSTVTAYTPTTTAPITNYIPVLLTALSGVARLDHNPTTGESLGLLIEEQRTNLLVRSEDFGTTWSNLNSSEQLNVLVAPDGTLTADKLVEDTANGAHTISQSASLTAAAHTASVYIKAGERTFARIILQDATPSFFTAYFNLSAGTVGNISGTGTTATITSVGNGWYRCTVTATTASGSVGVAIRTATANGTDGYTGDGYSGIYIWGAQLEAGSFPTSYIPTVASQVTRSADSKDMSGVGQQGQGTLYIEATVKSGNMLLTSGTTTVTATASTAQKTAVAYNATDTRKSINGSAVTSSAGTQGGTNLSIAPSATGHIKRVAIYPIKIVDAEMQGLTS